MQCRHVVLTGASGFLGKHILHSLITQQLEEGVQLKVHALHHGSHPDFDQAIKDYAAAASPATDCEVRTAFVDLTDPASVEAWMERDLNQVDVVDACIHLAAVSNPGQCQADPVLARALNVPQHFFAAILGKKRCPCIIALSTDHVYPGTNPPYSEEGEAQELKPINEYGATKYEMERHLLGTYKERSRVILLRSSIMLGTPGPIANDIRSKSTFLHFIATRENQETTFWTDEKRNVIWVGDVVAVIRWFLINDNVDVVSGAYNMGGPNSVSRFEIAKEVFDHFAYDSKYLVAKEKGQEQAQRPNNGSPAPLDISMDIQKLETLTKIKFTGLQEMVKHTFPSPVDP